MARLPVTAWLSPHPAEIELPGNGDWRQFTLHTSGPVKVVANPTRTARRVELSDGVSDPISASACPADQNDRLALTTAGQHIIYLAGCAVGKGTLELRRSADNSLIHTYELDIKAAVPGKLRNLSATPGDGRLTLTWAAPAHDGGAAITGYRLRYKRDDATTYTNFRYISVNARSHTITGYALRYKRDGVATGANPCQSVYTIKANTRYYSITGLTNGQGYAVQVWAFNSAGSGIANRAELTGLTPAPPPPDCCR